MKYGQHVTVALKNGTLAYGTWQVRNSGYVRLNRRFHRTAAQAVNIRLAEEGVTWCRGWRDETTDEGRALLAAQTMTADRPSFSPWAVDPIHGDDTAAGSRHSERPCAEQLETLRSTSS